MQRFFKRFFPMSRKKVFWKVFSSGRNWMKITLSTMHIGTRGAIFKLSRVLKGACSCVLPNYKLWNRSVLTFIWIKYKPCMIGEHSWITFLCCQCRCQIFKGERYFRTVFYYNFQTVLVAIVCLKAETSHYGAARGFYRPSLVTTYITWLKYCIFI